MDVLPLEHMCPSHMDQQWQLPASQAFPLLPARGPSILSDTREAATERADQESRFNAAFMVGKGKKFKKRRRRKREKLCCFQAIYMFISQENVTLYPFSQINFCVTGGIKRFDRRELKHSEMRDWELACTEHMFVIYRSQGRDSSAALLYQPLSAAWYVGLIIQGLPEVHFSRFFSRPPSGQTKCFPEQAVGAVNCSHSHWESPQG